MKEFNEVRDLGEILLDPIKIIFRNIKEMSTLMITAVMLPNLVVSYLYLKTSIFSAFNNTGYENPEYSILYASILVFAVVIMFLHVSLISACLIKVGSEDGQANITSKKLGYYFKKLYLRNILISILFFLIFGAMFGLIVLLFVNEMFGFGVFMVFIIFLACLLFFVPWFFYSQRHYLLTEGCGFGQALTKGRDDLINFYGISIGTIFVSSIISSLLRNMILIPFGIILMLLGMAIEFDFQGNEYSDYLILFQTLFLAVGLSYLYLYPSITIFLKSSDIQERLSGESTIQKIKEISISKETFFENEGEY
jgi:hypothetical protein